jgi:hypothetical protein
MFTQRNTVFPKVQHLRDEAARRAALFKIKPLAKAVSKAVLIKWLKVHPVEAEVDTDFLKNAANETYILIKAQAAEATVAERETLLNKNWTNCDPWLRLYHASIDD